MGPQTPLGSLACAVRVKLLPFLTVPANGVCLRTGGSSSAGPAAAAASAGVTGAAGTAEPGEVTGAIDSRALRVSSSTPGAGAGTGAGVGAGVAAPFFFLLVPFFVVDFFAGAGAGAGLA